MDGNAKAILQTCEISLIQRKTGSDFKPVNLFYRTLVNEKKSRNKNIININIFGCLSQNTISTGVAL